MTGSGWQGAVERTGEAMGKRQGPPPLTAAEKLKLAEIARSFGYENPRAFMRDLRHGQLQDRKSEIELAFQEAGLKIPMKQGPHGKRRPQMDEGKNLIQKLLGGLDAAAVKKLQELAETSDNPSLKTLIQTLLAMMLGSTTATSDNLSASKTGNGKTFGVAA